MSLQLICSELQTNELVQISNFDLDGVLIDWNPKLCL